MSKEIKKPFWDGDNAVRGCILKSIFSDYRVIVPSGTPNPNTGRLPKRGNTYPLGQVAEFLVKSGCQEINQIDNRKNVSHKARGDIDLAVQLDEKIFLVGEVKTRLLVRTIKNYGLDTLKLMLKYHLDSPNFAEKAWDELVTKGIISEDPKKINYDNPASISEIIREIVGFSIYHQNISSIIPTVVTMFYARDIINVILESLSHVKEYLSNCLKKIKVLDPTLLVIIPKFSKELYGTPDKIEVNCYGNFNICKKFDKEEFKVFGNCIRYRGCEECPYRGICRKYLS